jgi:hypothetical protein
MCGHLVGDWIFEDDWMARYKGLSRPRHKNYATKEAYQKANGLYKFSYFVCLIHCLMYTAAIFMFSFWWITWHGLLAVFVTHYIIDKFSLSEWFMTNFTGQNEIASHTGKYYPWSIELVDTAVHLVILFLIAFFTVGVT